MGTSFEKKPIKSQEASLFPDAAPSSSINTPLEKNTDSASSIPNALSSKAGQKSSKSKRNTEAYTTKKIHKNVGFKKLSYSQADNTASDAKPSIMQNNTASQDPEYKESQNTEIIDIDIDLITKKIQDILKSPSPLTLYKKSAELKEDFAQFINYLVKKIALGFNSQNKTIILSMYQNAGYEHIWFSHLKNYLDEAKYFDVRMYLKAITTFDKEKQYIAKALLKLHIGTSEDEVTKFLHKYDAKSGLPLIKSYYKLLGLHNQQIIDPKYLDENKIEIFLENLYFNSNDLGIYFQIFCFNIDEMRGKFKDTYEIFSDIARAYLKNVSQKTKLIYEYLHNRENQPIITEIDKQIDFYVQGKRDFYKHVSSLLVGKNTIERGYFWSYVKTSMIEKYFSEVSRLFYWDKNACSNRNEWSNLKGSFSFSPKNQYAQEINEILQFKKLILELNTNIISPFLKPLVYSIVSEKLSISRKDLLKIRYLMTLVMSENYQEYKKIYNFFEDLETFMDYNMEGFGFNFGKIKIFMADIFLGLAGLAWLYFYSPVGVFVSCLVLSGSYIRNHFFRFRAGIEWNLGIKPMATAMLIISTFYWITNLDTTKLDIAKLTSKVEKIGIYKTDVATKVAIKKLNDSGIKESVANILQSLKKK